MARNIQIKLTGAPTRTGEAAETVAEVRRRFGVGNEIASVNGQTVDDTYQLQDNDFVAFTPEVKGA